jgi:malonyl-CoA decarboxylase
MTGGTERMEQNENLIGRTLSNLAGAWRDIAQSAARTVGLNGRARFGADPASLKALMTECLEARGGEVSARMRAAGLGQTYLELDSDGRQRFLEIMAEDFAVRETAVEEAVAAYQGAQSPEGVKFLVDLRANLLDIEDRSPALDDLDNDLRELLASWFDTGFLDLRQITWDSPASLLEKLITYEAVHEIRSWDDLRNRLDSDRRLYALFHPRMPDEPLAFVEVALVKGIARNVQDLLDEAAPRVDPAAADTAIFYSITNTQKGLRGISFGEFLIKKVVERLARELPRIKTYATLSPVPGLRKWLRSAAPADIEANLSEAEQGGVRALGGSDATTEALKTVLARPDWHKDPVVRKALKDPLLRLCARYFLERRGDGQPIDPVARFHLKNGARLEHINWLGDTSPHGLRQAAGLMVNYRYSLDEIERNHEAYMKDGQIAMSAEVKGMLRTPGEPGGLDPLRRLGLR